MFPNKLIIFTLIVLCNFSWEAKACMFSEGETVTLLNDYPEKLQKNEIAATVKIIELIKPQTPTEVLKGMSEKEKLYYHIENRLPTYFIKAKVIEEKQNAKIGDVFTIPFDYSSCSRDKYPPEVNETYFVASIMDKDGLLQTERFRLSLKSTYKIEDK